jgi:hypothetical protein
MSDETLRASAVRTKYRTFLKALGGLPPVLSAAAHKHETWWHAERKLRGRKLPTQFTSDPLGYISDTAIMFGQISHALNKGKVKLGRFPLDQFHALEDALNRAEPLMLKKTKYSHDGGPMKKGFLTRAEAHFNPAVPRVAAVAGVSALAFAGYRIHQRRKLVQALLSMGYEADTASSMTAELLPLFSFKSADAALLEVAAQLVP